MVSVENISCCVCCVLSIYCNKGTTQSSCLVTQIRYTAVHSIANFTNLSVLPIGIAKQADDVVIGRGVKSNVPMMMSDSHFTSARFQVTGDRRKRRMKNGNFTSFRGAAVEKIFRFKKEKLL